MRFVTAGHGGLTWAALALAGALAMGRGLSGQSRWSVTPLKRNDQKLTGLGDMQHVVQTPNA
jgi:hypothetical protein